VSKKKIKRKKMTVQGVKDFIIRNQTAFIIAGASAVIVVLVLGIALIAVKEKSIAWPRITVQNNTPAGSVPSSIPTPSPTPTPTPVPLAQGPQTYSISQKDATPVMYEVWFSTIDPKKGMQKVNLKVRDKAGNVTEAVTIIKTDNKAEEHPLSLSSGTNKDGAWMGEWSVNDSYNFNFMITFQAKDDKGNESSVDLTVR